MRLTLHQSLICNTMDEKNNMSRRTFLKGSLLTGGSFMLSGILPAGAGNLFMADQTKDDERKEADILLEGICDIHIHAAPDSRMRSVDEWHFAQEAQKAGYRAIMYKSNDFSCHDRYIGCAHSQYRESGCLFQAVFVACDGIGRSNTGLYPPSVCAVAYRKRNIRRAHRQRVVGGVALLYEPGTERIFFFAR